MAYNGFLLKIGSYEFPQKYIKAESYIPYINVQDLDDYTDADGFLHINALDLSPLKVEFETTAMLTNEQFKEIMTNIRRNYTIPKARIGIVTAYIPEIDDYVTQNGYLSNFTPQIYGTYGGIIRYNSVRFAFIGGVYDG